MKSSKWILGLMVVVLMTALAPSSFAQLNIQIFNTAAPQEIQTNRNASTSDVSSVGNGILVSAALIAPSPLTTTYLVLTFPATITSSPGQVCLSCISPGASTPTLNADGLSVAGGIAPPVPTTDPIRIDGASGLFTEGGSNNVNIVTVNWTAGTITLALPGFGSVSNTQAGTFRLLGVRVDVNGKTAPLNGAVGLSSSSNNYILQTTSFPAINAVGAGISSAATGAQGTNVSTGTALMFTNQTGGAPAKATASVIIGEGFASAWRTTTQITTKGTDIAGMNGGMIRLTLAGLPAGVSAALSIAGSGGVAVPGAIFTQTGNTTATLDNTTAGTSNVTYVKFTSSNLSALESIQIDFTLSGTPTAALTPGAITLTSTMGPVGTALNNSGQPNLGSISGSPSNYIRFAQADVGPVTIGSIVAANTTLLIPYAVKVGAYDTGIAIANTTLDPFGSGAGGATPTAGTLALTMFPRNATGADPSFALTTSSTVRPGVGLSTSGTLVAGGVWTALMSDIMTAAGKTGDYFGYLFIQANFLDAHGAAYIFNGAGFTSATPVLVLPPPASMSRNGNYEALNN